MQDTIVGWIRGDTVSGAFTDSLSDLLGHDMYQTILGTARVTTGPALVPARNHLVDIFLSEPQAQYLLMLDSDMVFPPDILDRLRAVAAPNIIAGALCFGWFSDDRVAKPTMYDENMHTITRWEPGRLVPVHATGAACLLIHRRVFETAPGPYWFRQDEFGRWGEDQGFCRYVGEHGVKIVVDTSTPVLHDKSVRIGPYDYDPDAFERLFPQSDQSDAEVE
jgi:hypothetical protein